MEKNLLISNVTELHPIGREFFDLSGFTLINRLTAERVLIIDYISTQVIMVSGASIQQLEDNPDHNDRLSFISLASLPKTWSIDWGVMPDGIWPRINAATARGAGK